MDQYVVIWIGNDGEIGRTIHALNWDEGVETAISLAKENGESPTPNERHFLIDEGYIPFSSGASVRIAGLESHDVMD